MKKLLTSLLIGVAATSLIADESSPESAPYDPSPIFISHHELNPSTRVFRHTESNYSFTKIIGGIEYNYFNPEGLNFASFMGYSHSHDKSFFVAEWNVKYSIKYNDVIDFYPIIGLSNTSNFSTTSSGDNYQVYCGKLNTGVGIVYNYNDLFDIDAGLHYFKDVASSVILHKGDDFFGRSYSSPYGFKGTLDLVIPNIMNKDIVIGGFFAQTVKTAYKEFGLKLAVNFVF